MHGVGCDAHKHRRHVRREGKCYINDTHTQHLAIYLSRATRFLFFSFTLLVCVILSGLLLPLLFLLLLLSFAVLRPSFLLFLSCSPLSLPRGNIAPGSSQHCHMPSSPHRPCANSEAHSCATCTSSRSTSLGNRTCSHHTASSRTPADSTASPWWKHTRGRIARTST